MLFIIQPLEQRVIYKSKHFTGAELWTLDQLTLELGFMAEITTNESLLHVLNRAKGLGSIDAQDNGHFYEDRWVVITADQRPYEWAEIWPEAVKKFGHGNSHTLEDLSSREDLDLIAAL